MNRTFGRWWASSHGETVAAGLSQATSLPFLVAAADIGVELGELRPAAGAALVLAGLPSVLLFPLFALVMLRPGERPTTREE